MENIKQNQCPEFPYFGATYPDATCIDGYLWDLDKFEDGQLYGGGDEPCPFCNRELFIEIQIDNGYTKESIEKYIEETKKKYDSHDTTKNPTRAL